MKNSSTYSGTPTTPAEGKESSAIWYQWGWYFGSRSGRKSLQQPQLNLCKLFSRLMWAEYQHIFRVQICSLTNKKSAVSCMILDMLAIYFSMIGFWRWINSQFPKVFAAYAQKKGVGEITTMKKITCGLLSKRLNIMEVNTGKARLLLYALTKCWKQENTLCNSCDEMIKLEEANPHHMLFG